jgi:hypothetical protein
MTRDDIIRMAREAEMGEPRELGVNDYWAAFTSDLERFAALVAAAAVRETSAEYSLGWNDGAMMEREACAKVCETEWSNVAEKMYGQECAAAIRARGQE